MASTINHPVQSGDRFLTIVSGSVVIGATGAVGAVDTDGNGFTISRSGTGAYTLTLGSSGAVDIYPTSPANYVAAGTVTSPLVNIFCTIKDAGTRVIRQMTLVSETVATDGKINVIFDSAANTAADPNSGSTLNFTILLRNTTTPRKGS